MTVTRLPVPAPHRTALEGPDAPVPPPARLGSSSRDRQLVRAAALGVAGAWQQLVDAHAQDVWALARAAHLRTGEAVAVCEVVWLLLAEAVPELDGLPLAVWLRRTTTTEAHLAYLRAHPRPPVADRRRHERHVSG
jgi:hypothetical protein